MKDRFDLQKMLEEIKQDESEDRPDLTILSQEEIRRMMQAKPQPPPETPSS